MEHLKLLHRSFEEQVIRSPSASCLVASNGISLSYSEVNAEANVLARELRKRYSIGVNDPVVLVMHKSVNLFIAILGVLKAGAAYVPLSPSIPATRAAHILEETRPKCCICDAACEPMLRTLAPAKDITLQLEQLPSQLFASSNHATSNIIDFEQPIASRYAILYTSGSTGTPKGVECLHRGAANFLHRTLNSHIVLQVGDSVLQSSTVTFDVSVAEIFWALHSGATLVVPPDDILHHPAELLRILASQRVTLLQMVAGALKSFMTQFELNSSCDLGSLKYICNCGEALMSSLCNQHLALLPHAALLNFYGPTEASIAVTVSRCTNPDLITVGQAWEGVRIYVLDEKLQHCRAGVQGELYMAGVQLSSGYLNQPQLTGKAFVSDVFYPGERMYRSGDFAKILPNGDIVITGRTDHQVKLNGLRIELGEIEATLANGPGIMQAVAALQDHGATKQLVAFVTPANVDTKAAYSFAVSRLPSYMLPSRIVALAKLPKHVNGKVNRAALPRVALADAESTPLRQLSPMETEVSAVFAMVTGVRYNPDMNLSSQGLDSATAIRVLSHLNSRFALRLPHSLFWTSPTIAETGAFIEQQKKKQQLVSSEFRTLQTQAVGSNATPLSSNQQRMILFYELMRRLPLYNIPMCYFIKTVLDPQRMHHALKIIVGRHEQLHLTLKPEQSTQLVTPISSDYPSLLTHICVDSEEKAELLLRAEAKRPFDLTVDLPIRALLITIANSPISALCISLHHIAADGWSMGLILRDLAAAYANTPLPSLPPSVSYRSFTEEQERRRVEPSYVDSVNYWKRKLTDGVNELPVLRLPATKQTTPEHDHNGTTFYFDIPESVTTALRHFVHHGRYSMYMVLLAAFKALLHWYTNEENIYVGSPIAGRPRGELDPIVGFFSNTIVVRTTFGDVTFAELLEKVRSSFLEAMDHSEVLFEDVVRAVHANKTARTPLFQTMFVLQNNISWQLRLPGVESASMLPIWTDTAKFDLLLQIVDQDNAPLLRASLEYPTQWFDPSVISQMASYYVRLLSAAISSPSLKLADLCVVQPHELAEFHESPPALYPSIAPSSGSTNVLQLFSRFVQAQPNSAAIATGVSSLTYKQLDILSSRIAYHLINKHHITRGAVVGVLLPRSIEQAVALLGVLRTGAAYVPLDVTLPLDRLQTVCRSAAVSLCISSANSPACWSAVPDVTRLILKQGEGLLDLAAPLPTLDTAIEIDATRDVAYVVFTSGSTGVPKGIRVPHSALSNYVSAFASRYRFGAHDRMLQLAAFSFDVHQFEFFLPLCTGGAVVYAPPEACRTDWVAVTDVIARNRVTVAFFVPSVLSVLLTSSTTAAKSLASLRYVFAGGEAVTQKLGRNCAQLMPQCTLVNAYGPAEVPFCTLLNVVDNDSANGVSIGRTIPNIKALVLERNSLRERPLGAEGELCLMSDVGLALGYLDPMQTNAKFVITANGVRVYRTGDLVRLLPSGNLEFRGRCDNQVKVNGVRIELEEIDAALLSHPCIGRALGAVKNNTLVAYYTLKSITDECTAADLRRFLRTRLPSTMIPAFFFEVPDFALTTTFKLDRKSLPDVTPKLPSPASSSAASTSSTTSSLIEQLAALWARVLGRVVPVDSSSDFFEMGGNSLLMLRLRQLLLREFVQPEMALPLKSLFENTTLEAQAMLLRPQSSAVSCA